MKTISGLVACGLLWACGSDDDGAGDQGASHDAAAPADAPFLDAAVVDCAGDHQESLDRSNDPLTTASGEPEATGFVLRAAADPFTICGQIDPLQANATVVDGDYYQFTVGGDSPIDARIELVAPDGSAAEGLAIDLHRVVDGNAEFVATGPFRAGYGLIAGIPLAPGTYWVDAVAFHPAPDRPVLYGITIERNTVNCPRLDVASHEENADGAGRGNDMVAIDHPAPPALTASTMDAPEMTGIELAAGTGPVALTGLSAALEPAGDDYLDRDSYLLTAGAETNEVEVRLTWPNGDVDLDVYLFAAGEPSSDYSVGLGTTVGEIDDELFTVNLDPGRPYWLWVGAYKTSTGLAAPYTLTVCPRTNPP